MGIHVKNQDEFVVDLSIPGTQTDTAGANSTRSTSPPLPFDGFIKAVYAKLGTAGITGSQDVVVKKNGTNICSSTNPLVTFATTVATPTYHTSDLSADPTAVSKGDLLTAENSAVHSGTAAIDLALVLVIERFKHEAPGPQMQTDTYGADADAVN